MADRAKYGFGGDANEDDMPVSADAYKKGGKVKSGNVRGHGAERSGRTKGRWI